MTASSIITLIIFLIVAAIMIGIGIVQLRSSSPVGFYSGEKPLTKEELTDVHAWNKKHGMMWMIYGFVIIISYFAGYLIGEDSILCVIPFCGGLIVPIIIMIWYHNKLIKRYKR